MAYCTASDVRLVVQTGLSDTDIESIIAISDAQIDRTLGAQSTTDKAVKKLSMLLTARSIKQRQPDTVAVGEYSESTGDVSEAWSREIAELFRLYKPPSFTASEYRHIDEDIRYPEEAG